MVLWAFRFRVGTFSGYAFDLVILTTANFALLIITPRLSWLTVFLSIPTETSWWFHTMSTIVDQIGWADTAGFACGVRLLNTLTILCGQVVTLRLTFLRARVAFLISRTLDRACSGRSWWSFGSCYLSASTTVSIVLLLEVRISIESFRAWWTCVWQVVLDIIFMTVVWHAWSTMVLIVWNHQLASVGMERNTVSQESRGVMIRSAKFAVVRITRSNAYPENVPTRNLNARNTISFV
jgi:hypothetical protein